MRKLLFPILSAVFIFACFFVGSGRAQAQLYGQVFGRVFASMSQSIALLDSAVSAFGPVFTNDPVVTDTTQPPHLLHVSQTISPGETITVQGGYLGTYTQGSSTTTQVFLQLVTASGVGTPVSLQILSASPNLIQAAVPSTMQPGLWKLWVTVPQPGAASQTSNTLYVNQASGKTYDLSTVMAGTTFRVFGRNMVVSGGKSTVTFTPSAGGAAVSALVKGGTAYYVQATTPNNLAPGTYTISVSNGLGGASGITVVKEAMTVIAAGSAGADPLGIGVPWGTYYTFANNVYNILTDSRLVTKGKNDGVTDNTAAFLGAAQATQSVGGVIYLPAGVYYLASAVQLGSNTVFKGDGPGKTIIRYGSATTSGTKAFFTGPGASVSNIGFIGLSLENASSAVTGVMIINGGQNFVFDNVNMNVTAAALLTISNFNNLLVENCNFTTAGGLIVDSGNVVTDQNVILRNNVFRWWGSRLQNGGIANLLVENNQFIIDGNYLNGGAEDGGEQISGSLNPVILNNSYTGTGTKTLGDNAGELLISQETVNQFNDAGRLTSASGLTVTDTTKTWPATFEGVTGEAHVIYILDGPAMGQWRFITSPATSTAETASPACSTPPCDTLTIDHAWDIMPPANSAYAISDWTLYQAFIIGNTFTNGFTGYQVYAGGWDTVVANNNFTNTYGMLLYGKTNHATAPPSFTTYETSVYPVWNMYVANNTITTTSNPVALNDAPHVAHIWVSAGGSGYAATTGPLVLNAEIRNNLIACTIACPGVSPPGSPTDPATKGSYSLTNGFFNAGISTTPAGVPGILGSVYEGNATKNFIENSNSYGFYDATVDRQTIINNQTTTMTSASH